MGLLHRKRLFRSLSLSITIHIIFLKIIPRNVIVISDALFTYLDSLNRSKLKEIFTLMILANSFLKLC